MRLLHLNALIFVGFLWGSTFLLVKVALDGVPPMTLVAGRMLMAACLLVIAMRVTGLSWPRSRRIWMEFLLLGFTSHVFAFALITWGQQYVDSAVAGIVNASAPISTVLLAHLWIKERLTGERLAGIMVGFLGVVLLIGGDLSHLNSGSLPGLLAVLIGVQGWSVRNVLSRRYLQGGDPLVYAAGSVSVAASIMVPVALISDYPYDLRISPEIALAWTTLGVVTGVFAPLLFLWVIQHITAGEASTVSYLVPITAALLGVIVLGEVLHPSDIAGLVAIVTGVWIVNGGYRWAGRRLLRRSQPM